MRKVLFIVLLILNCGMVNAQFKIVAYLPKYTSTLADHKNAFDFTKVTHLNIAFFNPDVSGNFSASQGTGLDTIVNRAHLHNVKVLISLGGGSNQSQYANLLLAANRTAFVNKVYALVGLYGVDGIDVDIEGDNIDGNYEAFVTELSAKLKPEGKLLTAAVAWWTRDRITDPCLAAFDFINVMAYDKAGAEHAPYSYAKQHLTYWKTTRGLAAAKIVIGVPFYGYYTVGTTTNAMTYKQLVNDYPGAEFKDFQTRTDSYVVNYNGIATIKNKTAFAQGEAGGVMFWQVLQDDTTSAVSLLAAIKKKFNVNTGWKNPYISWKYDLGTGTGNLGNLYDGATAKSSAATIGTPGFLPYPNYGTTRVYLPASSGGAFELMGTGSATKLKLTASATSTPTKFSWYNIGEATSTATLYFNLALNASVTNGQLIIPFGYSTTTSSTFNNTSQLTSTSTADVFGAIRLDFYGGSYATLSYRNAAYGYTVINNNVFNKTGTYQLELYCNNEVSSRTYIRGGIEFVIEPQQFNIWVNGVRMVGAAGLTGFPASGELMATQVINSFSFNTSGNSGTPTSTPVTAANSLIATIDQVAFDFAFRTNPNPALDVLPISLLSFSGARQNNNAQLRWTTISEINNSHFEVLRSFNEKDFKTIGAINGAGFASTTKNYAFTDFNPAKGVNYYKLKQIDFDGKYVTSNLIAINLSENETSLKIFLHENDLLDVSFSSDEEKAGELFVYNLAGMRITSTKISIEKGYNLKNIACNKLAAGMYVVTLITDKSKKSAKFFKN